MGNQGGTQTGPFRLWWQYTLMAHASTQQRL
jgi:hypothetical protein